MKKHKEALVTLTQELKTLEKDIDFKEKAFNLDGSPSSSYLKMYSKIIKKYFDTTNTEEIKDFKTIREQSVFYMNFEHISNTKYEKFLQEFDIIEKRKKDNYEEIKQIISHKTITYAFFLEQTKKLKELLGLYEEHIVGFLSKLFISNYAIKSKEYEAIISKYEANNNKAFVTMWTKKNINFDIDNLLEYLKLFPEIIENKDEIEDAFKLFLYTQKSFINKEEFNILKHEYAQELEDNQQKEELDLLVYPYIKLPFKMFLNTKEQLEGLMGENYDEEEKHIVYAIFMHHNQPTQEEKELIVLELDYILLTEGVFIAKFEKLIKKTIHKNVQNRFVSSSVSGTISSSNQEVPLNSKMNKDNLLQLIRKEAMSYAMEGFLIGMRRYDISLGHQLSTYMTWWLEQRVTYYLEKDSSLNKATKTIDNLKNYKFEDAEEDNFKFHKFDNIKYSNYNFQNIEDMSNSITDKEFDNILGNGKNDLVYDILLFFCKYKHIFLYHEYLLLKYDLLLENFISFIDIHPRQEIIDYFYEDIDIFVNRLNQEEDYKNIHGFTKIKEFYKLPELLENYFNVEHSDFLSIKRTLKQKFINMVSKIFTNNEDDEYFGVERRSNSDDDHDL